MALFASTSARERLAGRVPANGKVEIEDLAAAGRLAASLRESENPPPRLPTAGEIYALSRIEEALSRLASSFLENRAPGAVERARAVLVDRIGGRESNRLLRLFGRDFSLADDVERTVPELPVWRVIEENPAATAAAEIFLPGPFRSDRNLAPMFEALERGLVAEPGGAETGESLFELLRAPARAEPDSLAGQLRYVIDRWSDALNLEKEGFLRGLDLLAEESKAAFLGDGGGPVEVPSFAGLEDDRELYSHDGEWMPSVVLLAKNVYVWLHQLSVAFERPIDRLDQIPDEALDGIAGRGFTGLWLIGVWERSAASRRLKRMCGNPEAEASAYSVRRYRIAEDLGGEAAADDLRSRCRARGLRLGADMVPNHMGIDSDWLLDEPQRFLSAPASPFPAYTFGGPDFSPRSDVGIYIEDHYFDRSDAAVVFKRLDRRTGEERFVYHGNDGTNMPWNDTAQLDYLNPETREAVIQTILEVARRFPIIRFDAAMTLARKHFHRLWFPEPGSGGDIPSRAERGLSEREFAERMPAEFWREVVDRVAAEVPDTLLLAEAFWLMEGYFVRTLGMHRVYNSAFMHMVRDERNGEFRELLKETLAFDPRILRRYVNFLTNPDERTAIDQFGTGDRYFGACVLLATLPGLPMFGHGQIEGHAEKYGMEYRRSYLEEPANEALVERHEHEIFPLLLRRRHFAGVENFELFDFVAADGRIVDSVLAYSNGEGSERTLVVFNNSFSTVSGRLLLSVPRSGRAGVKLGEALGLGGEEDRFWIFDDSISGRTFIRPAAKATESGLDLEIPGFGYRVFDGFRLASEDAGGRYGTLASRLGGAGVDDLDRALGDLDLEPAAEALRELLHSEAMIRLSTDPPAEAAEADTEELADGVWRLLDRLPDWAAGERTERSKILSGLAGALELGRQAAAAGSAATETSKRFFGWLNSGQGVRRALFVTPILAALAKSGAPGIDLETRLGVRELLRQALEEQGLSAEEAGRASAACCLAASSGWTAKSAAPEARRLDNWIRRWTAESESRELIGFHSAEGVEWVSQEGFEELVRWRVACGLAWGSSRDQVESWLEASVQLEQAAREAGYRVDLIRSFAAEPQASESGAGDSASLSKQTNTAKQ